jgi:hypothetical protein
MRCGPLAFLLLWAVPMSKMTPRLSFDRIDGRPELTLSIGVDDRWQVEYRLVARTKSLAIAELRVLPRPGAALPPGGLPARVLRKVRVGDYLDVLGRAAHPDAPTKLGEKITAFLQPLLAAPNRSPAGHSRRRPGRPPLTDDLLDQVVRAYNVAIAQSSRRPVRDAARQLDKKPARVRDLLHRARMRGKLPKPKPGRALSGNVTLIPKTGELAFTSRILIGRSPSPQRRKSRRGERTAR